MLGCNIFFCKNVIPLALQAYAISAIAHWDWPETWPELFGTLMHALLSDDSHFVHGAMRVLTEFSSEVTESQIPQVAPIILPQMCLILTEDTVRYLLRYMALVEISCFVLFCFYRSCDRTCQQETSNRKPPLKPSSIGVIFIT